MVAVKAPVGASGFVGRRRCPVLAEAGHDVAAMTRDPAAYAGAGTPTGTPCRRICAAAAKSRNSSDRSASR